MNIIKAIYYARKYKGAPVLVPPELTGLNPVLNPQYRKLSLANNRLTKSPKIKSMLIKLGVLS
jgi:hypothetical protein